MPVGQGRGFGSTRDPEGSQQCSEPISMHRPGMEWYSLCSPEGFSLPRQPRWPRIPCPLLQCCHWAPHLVRTQEEVRRTPHREVARPRMTSQMTPSIPRTGVSRGMIHSNFRRCYRSPDQHPTELSPMGRSRGQSYPKEPIPLACAHRKRGRPTVHSRSTSPLRFGWPMPGLL